MANVLYPSGRAGFLSGQIDWDTASIKTALVRGSYNASHSTVKNFTDAGGVLHAVSGALSGKTFTDGIADANDVVFTAPAANANNHYVLFFQASAVGGGSDIDPSLQRLIAWMDTGAGIPGLPNGSNITLTFDNGANKIFKL